MEKNVLVCIANRNNAELLVEKGKHIANSYESDCFALSVESEGYDEYIYEHVLNKETLKSISEKYNSFFLFKNKNGKKLSIIISEVAKKYNISHIVIGQPPRSKWDIISQGSLINELFSLLKNVDLHIVQVSTDSIEIQEEYQRGVTYYLHDDTINEEKVNDNDIKGIFYQSCSSQFINGIFHYVDGNNSYFYKVMDKKVKK